MSHALSDGILNDNSPATNWVAWLLSERGLVSRNKGTVIPGMRRKSQSSKIAPVSTMPPSTVDGVRIPIGSDVDIVKARQEGRKVAADAGFASTQLAVIATAISELARNIVRYARSGEISIRPITNSTHQGIQIVAQDQGPGIRDLEQALQIGFSTSGGLGLGLPGVRRLMDEFDIQSDLGRGTTVSITKWRG
jgi:serine/threonine-protein kinase RsbT